MLDLARHIVATKRGHFEPEKFEDRYEEAVKELLQRKAKGEKIEAPKRERESNVVNLIDALRASVKAEGGKKKPAKRAAPRRTAGKRRKAS